MAKDHGYATSRERQWKARMEAWQSSDQTQQAFCKAHRLKYSTFCYWRRRLRALGAMKRPAPRQPSSFVPEMSCSLFVYDVPPSFGVNRDSHMIICFVESLSSVKLTGRFKLMLVKIPTLRSLVDMYRVIPTTVFALSLT
jgi:hypothetical protein